MNRYDRWLWASAKRWPCNWFFDMLYGLFDLVGFIAPFVIAAIVLLYVIFKISESIP